MSKFQFGETHVAKTAEAIREGKEQGNTALIPPTPDSSEHQEVQEQPMEQEHGAALEQPKEEPQQAENAPQPKEEPQQVQQVSQVTEKAPSTNKALAAIKDKGTTNGIVVNVPMEDYFQLMMLKKIEKKTLKELALQAIHEFVERNKVM